MRTRLLRSLAAVLTALCFSAPAATRPAGAEPINYEVAPVLDHGALKEVRVQVRLRADPDGTTVLDLPDSYGGVKAHWRYLSALRVEGGTVESPGPARRLIRSAPRAPLTIGYTVRSAYAADPDAAGANPYNGAVIRPAWFASLGEFLFVAPEGRGAEAARLRWRGWPASWKRQSSADRAGLTVDALVESSFLAGPDVEIRTRPIRGGTLRLASRGTFGWSLDRYTDQVAAVIDAQRSFWKDADGDYSVTLFKLAPAGGVSSTGGTGRAHGFVQYASEDTQAETLFRVLAHEHAHNWIPRQLGSPPEGEGSAALFWLSEGFTDYYTARSLLRAGLWTPKQFADDLNRALAGVSTSAIARAPNSRIVAEFWTDPAVGQLPYDRGHLFAHLLDDQLRKGEKGRLDDVLAAMQARWRAAPPGSKLELLSNLLSVLDSQGFDARALIAAKIEKGEPIVLPPDLLGSCAAVVQTVIPLFDPGFDREASARAGAFAGVDRAGRAYAAGLRDGMQRAARLGGSEGDSRVPLSYRVRDRENERVLSWLPQGRAWVTLQEVRLRGEGQACRALASR